MLDLLPRELKLYLLELSEDSNLRFISRDFYKLHNSLSRLKVSLFIDLNQVDLELVKSYQRSLSFWNGPLSELLEPDVSWSILFAFVKNRRLYFQDKTCIIQKFSSSSRLPNVIASMPDYEIDHGTLKLHNVQAVYYQETISLPKGAYNFQVAIINHRSSRGLGTTTFQIGDLVKSYPSTFINEMIPEGAFAVLNLSKFQIFEDRTTIDVAIEEVGMYPKIGIELCYLQFTPYREFEKVEEGYMFYSVPRYNVNSVEKLVYMNLQGIKSKYIDEIDLKWYKAYYEDAERKVKMLYPMDQNTFQERQMRGSLANWKVPF